LNIKQDQNELEVKAFVETVFEQVKEAKDESFKYIQEFNTDYI